MSRRPEPSRDGLIIGLIVATLIIAEGLAAWLGWFPFN